MEHITVEIDGSKYEAPKGSTILDIARANGIYIPTLCYDERLNPYGACRLCLVEVEGARGLLPACYAKADDGMVVRTTTEQIEKVRKTLVELLVSDHPIECAGCTKSGRCELQELIDRYEVDEDRFAGEVHSYTLLDENPFIARDYNKCVNCGRCIRICREVQGVGVYDFVNRGFQAVPGTPYGNDMQDTPCEFCGLCVSTCPTGALKAKPFEMDRRNPAVDLLRAACAEFKASEEDMIEALGLEAWTTRTTCGYCGCGCQADLHVVKGEITDVTAPIGVGSNNGSLCVKGHFGLDFVSSTDRLVKPLIRKGGKLVQADWDEALDLVAEKLGAAKGCGAQGTAILSSGRITNEESYLVQKFARGALGTNNIDNCTRICQAPSIVALQRAFGDAAMTNSLDDIAEAKAMIVIGSNITESHPIAGQRVKRAVMQNDCKLIVIDPKQIKLTNHAEMWLAIKPGTDVALLNAMMNVIISENLHDKEFTSARTEGFDALQKSVGSFTPEKAEEITGIAADDIREAARAYASAENAAILYSTGVTQHTTGTDAVTALANLAMITGNIGKAGAGLNMLRMQNNLQGACDMGTIPNFGPGYKPVSGEAGMTLPEMLDAAKAGSLKAMLIIGENPAKFEPKAGDTVEALRNLEFLAVIDIFMNETTQYADVILPAASFAEKDGTFTNTERKVQRVRKSIDSPGEAKADSWIITELANRMGMGLPDASPAEIMTEIASEVPAYAGITYERLDEEGFLQWPCTSADDPGTKIMYTESFTRGKGLISPVEYKAPAETTTDEYPLVLTTGRILSHGGLTGKVAGMSEIMPEPVLWITPADADRYGIVNGEVARIRTARGMIDLPACVTDMIAEGVIFVPFNDRKAPANRITNYTLDPEAKTPEYKACAANVASRTECEANADN